MASPTSYIRFNEQNFADSLEIESADVREYFTDGRRI
jgi:hypothetical protein